MLTTALNLSYPSNNRANNYISIVVSLLSMCGSRLTMMLLVHTCLKCRGVRFSYESKARCVASVSLYIYVFVYNVFDAIDTLFFLDRPLAL